MTTTSTTDSPGAGTGTGTGTGAPATTCAGLTAAQVGRLLKTDVGEGVPDPRTATDGRRQLDGCTYSADGGVRLGYLVWQVAVAGDQDLVEQGLPPAGSGARSFSPETGRVSAGAVVTTGPVTTAQVNAVVRKRLVQVSATAATAALARSAATSAAATLIGD
ncbi:hypothetical protein [Kineosporia succinea]|uniref:Uncharacterized protein n=1 Tax=Kineosporia succinea TaxID=84632 RepID=A0ABT9PDF9_9ACTN|nr:hypothetical protein [Kineosporia succinea]